MLKIKNYFKDLNNTFTFVFLIIICVSGFAIRAINLGYLSFWGDDGHTFIGTISVLKYGFPRLPSGNILWHGIFDYYLKALPALFFGANEFSLRIVSVLLGTGTIIATYFTGKELANKFVGFFGAAVIAYSTWFIQFSREARYYSDYQFFYIISFLFFYLGFVKNKRPFRILASVFMVLSSLVHGVGMTLIFLFIVLLFYKGRKFFKKEIIIPMVSILFLYILQVVNQIFFWKVGRSFYIQGTGTRAALAAYFKIPDPFYFKITNIMFPKMYYTFMAGVIIFIILVIVFSVRKRSDIREFNLNENIVSWGQLKWPFNMFLIYFTFLFTVVFISIGRMYGQERYMYFLIPLFILGTGYVIYLASMILAKLLLKALKTKSLKVLSILLSVFFIALSVLLVNGVSPRESLAIPFKEHNSQVNTLYSISNIWKIHWDAAQGGRYVAQNMEKDDIVITTDIYNSPPYTGKVDYWLWTGNLVSWAPYHDEGTKVIDDTYGVEVIRNIMGLIDILNENSRKNIWILTSKSLFTEEHVDPAILKFLDGLKDNLVLTARDDVSRLYYFPKTCCLQRISLEKVFNPSEENIIKTGGKDEVLLDFRNTAAQKYLIFGFSHTEETGTWAEGDTSVMFLNIEDNTKDLEFDFIARPFDNKKERQKVELFINGSKTHEFEFTQTDDFSEFSFVAPKSILKQGINEVVFKYKYNTVPKELNISSDGRKLSIMFQKLFIKTVQ